MTPDTSKLTHNLTHFGGKFAILSKPESGLINSPTTFRNVQVEWLFFILNVYLFSVLIRFGKICEYDRGE